MTASIIPAEPPAVGSEKTRFIDRAARKILLELLKRLSRGRISLIDGDQRYSFGSIGDDFQLAADITVRHPKFYTESVFGGSVGAAEAYINGYWTTDDLTALIRILIQNQHVFDQMEKGLARLAAPANRLLHFLNRNTRRGSRGNIQVHYDLGNDFYQLFLDQTLTYSCGIFETERSSLKEASIAKYDRICRKLQLDRGDQILEIGTGWGGFAIHAAGHYDCRVTTTTISENQYHLAGERFAAVNIRGPAGQ